MAEVKVHTGAETPSQSVVNAANQLVYVTDSRGRKLGLRQLPFLEEFRIIETLGPELSKNETYMKMVNPLLFLAEIDGELQPIPRTKLAIDALIQTAGREGYLAVWEGILKHFSGNVADLEEQIKNGDGTPV